MGAPGSVVVLHGQYEANVHCCRAWGLRRCCHHVPPSGVEDDETSVQKEEGRRQHIEPVGVAIRDIRGLGPVDDGGQQAEPGCTARENSYMIYVKLVERIAACGPELM